MMFSNIFRSDTPLSAMGEDSNHSVMSDSQDGTEFDNKINQDQPSDNPTSDNPIVPPTTTTPTKDPDPPVVVPPETDTGVDGGGDVGKV
jgi:hypothetical protein